MTTSYIVSQNIQAHLHHLRESIERLHGASAGWSASERARGEVTISNLERQVESIKSELFRAA